MYERVIIWIQLIMFHQSGIGVQMLYMGHSLSTEPRIQYIKVYLF